MYLLSDVRVTKDIMATTSDLCVGENASMIVGSALTACVAVVRLLVKRAIAVWNGIRLVPEYRRDLAWRSYKTHPLTNEASIECLLRYHLARTLVRKTTHAFDEHGQFDCYLNKSGSFFRRTSVMATAMLNDVKLTGSGTLSASWRHGNSRTRLVASVVAADGDDRRRRHRCSSLVFAVAMLYASCWCRCESASAATPSPAAEADVLNANRGKWRAGAVTRRWVRWMIVRAHESRELFNV